MRQLTKCQEQNEKTKGSFFCSHIDKAIKAFPTGAPLWNQTAHWSADLLRVFTLLSPERSSGLRKPQTPFLLQEPWSEKPPQDKRKSPVDKIPRIFRSDYQHQTTCTAWPLWPEVRSRCCFLIGRDAAWDTARYPPQVNQRALGTKRSRTIASAHAQHAPSDELSRNNSKPLETLYTFVHNCFRFSTEHRAVTHLWIQVAQDQVGIHPWIFIWMLTALYKVVHKKKQPYPVTQPSDWF